MNPNLPRRIAAALLVVGGAALYGPGALAAPDCTKVNCGDPAWIAACTSQKGADWCQPGGGDVILKSATPAKTVVGVPPIGADRTPKPVYRMPMTLQVRPKAQPVPGKGTLVPAGMSLKAPGVAHPAAAANGLALPGTAVDTQHFSVGAVAGQRLRLGGAAPVPGFRLQVPTPEGANAKADFINKGMDSLKSFGDDPAKRLAKEAAAMKNRRPTVGDPLTQDYHKSTNDTSRWVRSCDDYVYKKYFEYNWFLDTIQALGSDYRAIFDVATRQDSPVRITRHLRSFGPVDVPPQKMELATGDTTVGGSGMPVMINLDFENSGLAERGGSTLDADWEITSWNSFYTYMQEAGTPLTKGVGRGGMISVWAGVNQPNVTKWFDLAMKLEKSHAAFSDGELEWAAERSKHLADLVTQRRQAIWGYARAFCAKYPGAIPMSDSQGTFTCLARKDGLPSTPSLPPGGKPSPNGPKLVQAGQANSAAQNGSSALYNSFPITPQPPKAPAVLIIQGDIDAAIQTEKQLLASNPKESCLNPDPLASACTWSYRKFAGIIQDLEHDLTYRLTHNVLKQEVATLAGPSYDLAKCRHYLPDFNVVLDDNDPDKTHSANNKIYHEVMAQRLWFSAYEPTKEPSGDINTPPSKAHVRGYWAENWSKIEKLFDEYDIAKARWAQFGEQRKLYLGEVAQLTKAAASLPWNKLSIGQSSSDHFDQGTDMFGATAEYHLHWEVDPVASTLKSYPSKYRSNTPLQTTHGDCSGISCGDEKYVCRYNGSMNAGASAAALVLGGSISILDTGFTSWAKDDTQANAHAGAHMDAHFTFLGDELVLPPVNSPSGSNSSSTGQFTIAQPVADTNSQVPDPPFEVDFAIGPIPCSLQAGLVLSAGIDLSTTGQIGDSCQQPLPELVNGGGGTGITRPVNPPNFGLASTVDPFIQVSGFAQVGVDLVFVQAGVRIDLEVVRLGIPITVGVSTGAQDSAPKAYAAFGTHAEATFEALSGELSAYVDVNYLAGSYHYEQPIFGWDGLHASKPLFAYNKYFDLEGLNYQVNPPKPPTKTFEAMQQ